MGGVMAIAVEDDNWGRAFLCAPTREPMTEDTKISAVMGETANERMY
jgi:hypothetical protein